VGLWERLVQKHSTGSIYVAWNNVSTHADDEVEAVVHAAALVRASALAIEYEPAIRIAQPLVIKHEVSNFVG
jgi:hypothetical protein